MKLRDDKSVNVHVAAFELYWMMVGSTSLTQTTFPRTSFQHSCLIHTATFCTAIFPCREQREATTFITIQTMQRTTSRTTFRLPIPLETIDVEFKRANGEIMWCPEHITSIPNPEEGKTSLVSAEMTYDARANNKDHFSDVELASVLFLYHKSLWVTSKSDTLNCNSILFWSYALEASSATLQEDNFPYQQKLLMVEALSPPVERIPEVHSMTD